MADADLVPLPDDWGRALAIAAHPDDLEYGAASAVARWTAAGKAVSYLLVTSGEAGLARPPEETAPLRREEERAGAAEVGVHDVEFLDHPDGVVEYGLPLRRDLAAAIRRDRPDVVVTVNHHDTWGGRSLNMADHRHVGLAVLDAVRDAANPWVFPESGAAWDGIRMTCVSGSPAPTHAVEVTGFLDRGIASLRCHRVYLEHVGQSPDQVADFLRDHAESTGARAGVEHAVAFEVFES